MCMHAQTEKCSVKGVTTLYDNMRRVVKTKHEHSEEFKGEGRGTSGISAESITICHYYGSCDI